MREQHPKASSSRLVRMKALIALVTFWILRSLVGPVVCLRGQRQACEIRFILTGTLNKMTLSHDHDVFINRLSSRHDSIKCSAVFGCHDSAHVPLFSICRERLLLFAFLHPPVHDISN